MPPRTPEAAEPEYATAGEAMDALGEQEQAEPESIIYYDAQSGEPLNSDPKAGPVEAVTLERAADDLVAYENSVVDHTLGNLDVQFAAEVDRMRSEVLENNPEFADELGIEPKDAKAGEKPADLKSEAPVVNANGELDPVLAQKIADHPQVRSFIETERENAVREGHQAREQYSNGLEQARIASLSALAEIVPHLSGLPPARFEEGLQVLSQVDPPAFQQAMNVLQRTYQITQAQQQAQQHQAYAHQQQFEVYGKSEDAKFREMLENDPGKMKEAATEVVSYLEELGIGQDRLVHLLRTDPTIRSAEGQKILTDAARYRAMHKAAKPTAARNLPLVQRPGVSMPRASAADESVQLMLRALDSEKSESKQMKIAAKILALRAG
jgi:hypothetical protein